MDEMTNMADNPAARLAEVEETLRQALAAFQPKDDVLAFSFEDIFQLFLYHKIFAPKKPVEPCPIQFSRLYRLKGRLLAEAGDYAGAAGALTEALTWNPVDPEAVFELAEVHKLRRNIHAFLDETRRAFGLAVTREQLALMLYRYVGAPAVSGSLDSFPDADSVSDWAVQGMTWAVENGLITGTGAGELNPQGTASRAEVATLLARFVAGTN